MNRGIVLAFLAGLVALILSACGAGGSGQPQLKLAPAASLPKEMQTAPVTVREAYQFALANQENLQKIPCYCGCGGVDHTSVKDCFVQEVRADGTVIWDEMGLG